MLIVTLMKAIFDENHRGQTKLIANVVLAFVMIVIIIVSLFFENTFWVIFKSFITLSVVRFWYVLGLHWFEKLYLWCLIIFAQKVKMLWKKITGIFKKETE
jgi:hypothetical protein